VPSKATLTNAQHNPASSEAIRLSFFNCLLTLCCLCFPLSYFSSPSLQTGAATDQPFSPLISLASFLQQCADIFGVEGLTPNIEWINEFYGGNQIVTDNTVFTGQWRV
jgi:hypothetical protein